MKRTPLLLAAVMESRLFGGLVDSFYAAYAKLDQARSTRDMLNNHKAGSGDQMVDRAEKRIRRLGREIGRTAHKVGKPVGGQLSRAQLGPHFYDAVHRVSNPTPGYEPRRSAVPRSRAPQRGRGRGTRFHNYDSRHAQHLSHALSAHGIPHRVEPGDVSLVVDEPRE